VGPDQTTKELLLVDRELHDFDSLHEKARRFFHQA